VSRLFEKLFPYKNLLKNFTSLSVLQLSNYLFPLIILPYVVRVLGPDKYGLVQFAAAFNSYFLILCDYGFGLTGTRMISQNRNDPQNLSRIFSSIVIIRLLLFVLSFMLITVVVFSFERFILEWQVYLLSSGIVFGSTLFPLWFFQGLEQMKYITILQIAIRIVSIVFIFILIQSSADYIIFVLINSSTQIVIGIAGVIIAVTKFKINIFFPGINQIVRILKEGWNIFLSSIWINLYTTSNTFILGLLTNDTIVGYYAAADKLRIAFQGVHSTLSLSVFPFVNQLVKESYENFINFNRRLLKLGGIGGFIVSLILFIFAYDITDLVLGQNFSHSGDLLRIISLLPLIISLSNVFGIQTMLPLGYDKSFNKIIVIAAVIHLPMLFILTTYFMATGVAYSVVLTETIVTIGMFAFLKTKKIDLLSR
jgi:polysaccharide transporter, PST family